jgi:hypothetical protein
VLSSTENIILFIFRYADAVSPLFPIWQYFVRNNVSQNNNNLFKFHYAIAAMWQHLFHVKNKTNTKNTSTQLIDCAISCSVVNHGKIKVSSNISMLQYYIATIFHLTTLRTKLRRNNNDLFKLFKFYYDIPLHSRYLTTLHTNSASQNDNDLFRLFKLWYPITF